MNRDQLIQAAIKDVDRGDDSHPAIAQAHYLRAIAKLLLAQTMPVDAHASPGPLDPEHRLDQHVHCRICHKTLLECVCGPPPSTPWVDWGEDENP